MRIFFDVNTNENNELCFLTNGEGNDIIRAPLLNKGSAFSKEERETFKLNGLLPPRVLNIEKQIEKLNHRYHRFGVIFETCKNCKSLTQEKKEKLKKEINITRFNFLRDLHDRNEILFYAFCFKYLKEVIPIIYTPTVGEAVLRYSRDSARFRGIFLSPYTIDRVESVFDQFRYHSPTIAVVTDNQGILGLGDQGVGGIDIPIGKLSLYVLGAGIRPWETLPLTLDVGTNNPDDLNDPLYLGYNTGRLEDKEYDGFIDRFIEGIRKKFPNILIQWEDFSRQNAFSILDRYRKKILSFNDDIQGTGAVALAGVLNALKYAQEELNDQRFIIYGAGAGGIGIARQIASCLQSKFNLTEQQAADRIIIFDSKGMVTTDKTVAPYKAAFAKDHSFYRSWNIEQEGKITLLEAIKEFQSTVLIGTSGCPGHFTPTIIQAMNNNCNHPVIMPLSNPTDMSEATPQDIYKYSDGKALVATGSPFDPFNYKGKQVCIGQGNNFFIFPGVGLGAIISQADYISNDVFTEAAYTLSKLTPPKKLSKATLYPSFTSIRQISSHIAHSTNMMIAQEQGKTELTLDQIKERMWIPSYPAFKKSSP